VLQDVWRYRLSHTAAAFVADGEYCYATARSTKLIALDIRTGEVRWTVPVRNPHGWLALNERAVFYLNQHTRLVALARESGILLWQRDLRGINGWLHATATRVVVGGWRGYTDVTVLNEGDGTTCWSLSAHEVPHSTRVHAESDTLMVVEPTAGCIKFVRLSDGEVDLTYPAGYWEGQSVERPPSTQGKAPAVVEAGAHRFLVVQGATPSVSMVSVEPAIRSRNLSTSGSVVPFVTDSSELAAWHLGDRRLLRFGRIEHNRNDLLPFCQVATDAFVVGTSSGMVAMYHGQVLAARRRVAKRIETLIGEYEGTIVFGTASGEIVALNANGDG
jgi:outer membrane protein assembly factor BamB